MSNIKVILVVVVVAAGVFAGLYWAGGSDLLGWRSGAKPEPPAGVSPPAPQSVPAAAPGRRPAAETPQAPKTTDKGATSDAGAPMAAAETRTGQAAGGGVKPALPGQPAGRAGEDVSSLRDEVRSLHDDVKALGKRLDQPVYGLDGVERELRGLFHFGLALLAAVALLTVLILWWVTTTAKTNEDYLTSWGNSLREQLKAAVERIEGAVNAIPSRTADACAERLPIAGDPAAVLGRRRATDKAASPDPPPGWSEAMTPSEPPPPLRLEAIYNRARDSEEAQGVFLQQYPGEFLGVVNAAERARQPGIKPIFGKLDKGDFYAFLDLEGGNRYRVVPRFGRILTRERFESGGWSDVFECSQFNPGTPQTAQLVRPATLERSGDSWTVAQRGRLSA
jgi:hypothetical protein